MAAPSLPKSPFLGSPATMKASLIPPTRKSIKPTFAMDDGSPEEEDHGEHHYRYSGGRLVDESMTVLRRRIHEMKVMERNYEPPANWMGWEKKCYSTYDSMIFDAVGSLQVLLMDTRPSVAVGIIALLAISLPTSLFVFSAHGANRVIDGIIH